MGEAPMLDAPMLEALRGRRVFLTGHTGFKGSWAALWLSRLGARVVGYALDPPTGPSNFVASRVARFLEADHRADLLDADRLAGCLSDASPDVVLHLAAQPLVRAGLADPRGTFATNVLGTVNVLDAVRRRGRPCVVLVVTSDKCYQPIASSEAFREGDPLGGDDPYSASKGAAELVTHAYREGFFPPDRLGDHGVAVATVRAGNVLGGGDWAPDRVATDILEAFARGERVPLRMPNAVRPWQHVLEPLAGYLQLACRMLSQPDGRWCGAWNFGPDAESEVSVAELTAEFARAWGAGGFLVAEDALADRETVALRLDSSKARGALGWAPRWSLAEAVRRTVAWRRAYALDPSADASRACLEDIRCYEGALHASPTLGSPA